METIDFGCQVRCLNRQRLIPGSTHPQLNQCASQFLAKVRKEVMTLSDSSTTNSSKMPEIGWMKLKLSERGLRILPSTSSISSASSCASSTTSSSTSVPFTGMRMQKNRKSDEGFESDSDTSIQPHNNSGGSSSGVNSSSSDIEEADEVIRNNNNKKSMTMNMNAAGSDTSDSDRESADVLLTVPIRCSLSDILSCQHPPALGRHVVLLTLRSADDSALDILALECSAEEPARILTMLCQKIQASGTTATTSNNHPAPSVAAQSTCAMATNDPGASGKKPSNQQQQQQPSAVGSNVPVTAKTAAVSIQSWSDRDRDKRTLDAILVDSKHSSTLSDIGVGVKTQNIIRKLERQHSEWSLIQRRTHDGLTHLQISKQQKSSSTFLNHTGVAVGGGDVGVGAGIRSHTNASVQTTTSGAMLNSSNNNNSSKKGMPYGGQLARLETSLAITNSHQGQSSRSSGIGSVAAGLKRSETTATAMHHKLSKSKSSGSSVASGSSSSQSSCILSLQTRELPMGPSVTGLSPTVVTDASTSTSQSPTPLCVPQSLPPTKTSRWSFGAPFRQQQQQRQHSPEASRRNPKSNQRGRSSERKSTKSDSVPQTTNKSTAELNGLFVSSSGMLSIKSNNNINNSNSKKNLKTAKSLPEILPVPAVAPKIKRDPSKTRSFLMKLTSSSRKSPTPPTISAPPSAPSSTLSLGSENSSETQQRPQHPLKLQSRGRSLIRLRSSTRLQSPPPPPASQGGGGGGGQTFLIPTKSGQELTRNIYPKEGPITQSSSSQQQQQQALPVFHLLTGHNNKNASGRLRYNNGAPTVTAMSNGWAGYCWNEAAAAAALVRHPIPTYPTSMDSNNNQHLHQQHQQQQQQQQWIYFHPHPVHHPAPPPQPPPTLIKAGDFNKLRLQRSRSQSPGRMRSSQRWLPPPPPAPPPAGPSSIGHYYAVPSPIHHQQPVSLPPDMSHMLSQQQQQQSHRISVSNSTSNSSNQELLSSSAAARSFRRSKSTHTRMSSRSHLAPSSKSNSQNHNNNNKAVTFHAFATVQLVD